ncbi:MAG: MerR family transcriptional regulator [Gammaproteobacteria bacterium]|nr:MerR family transcriptional regulator [Gammaproteobacteria bacterium]
MTDVSGYRIGKVSKLTGISSDTLRIWERRYAAVVPVRTEAGGRLYTADDIARLKLIKNLVDGGDSIGNVATLSIDQLQARADETIQVSKNGLPQSPIRLLTIGESLTRAMKAAELNLEDIELVASYPNINNYLAEHANIEADVLVIEQPTLQTETSLQIMDWLDHAHASHAVVIYRFANQDALEKLPRSKSSTLRAPANPQTIREHCLGLHSADLLGTKPKTPVPSEISESAPARRYSDDALAKIASISPVIQCECPHHLAELISSLSAFEKYSSECESRNREDAEMHAYLSRTASHARHMIENALDMVIEIENIEV